LSTTTRKRLRSSTPSEVRGVNDEGGDDALRSPLAKRKRLAAERSGASKLKQEVSAAEVGSDGKLPALTPVLKKATASPRGSISGSIGSHSTGSDNEDEDDGEDFLADAFGEDGWS
jgi:RNA polymerase II subunit A-like phosphatase